MILDYNKMSMAKPVLYFQEFKFKIKLTRSALQTKTENYENSPYLDDTPRKEPSHQDLHCLPWIVS